MKRVLVFGMTENPGGIESFLLNYYKNIDRNQLQFDFLCNSYNQIAYEDELLALGARTFHISSRRDNRRRFHKELDDLFSQHSSEWCAIWVNVCSLANIDYLKKAKDFGIGRRIIHSHNSENMDGLLRGILHRINRSQVVKYATDFWACSRGAAKWFYKDELMKKVIIIPNAINISNYKYNDASRNKIRELLGVDDQCSVIGNIGRFHFQKNQKFAIQAFSEYNKANKNSLLVLIGQGEDEKMLREECSSLGIDDKVRFVGVQSNIGEWLSSFDLLLFPSLFEGLSVVPMEAQASGVSVLASKNVIPEDVAINENFYFYDLSRTAAEWADKMALIIGDNSRPDFSDIEAGLKGKGYDIVTEARTLEKMLKE